MYFSQISNIFKMLFTYTITDMYKLILSIKNFLVHCFEVIMVQSFVKFEIKQK